MKDFQIDVTPFKSKDFASDELKNKAHSLYLQALKYIGKIVVLKSHPEMAMTVHSTKIERKDIYYNSEFCRFEVFFGCMRFCKSSQSFVEQYFSIHCLELKNEQ